MASVSFLTVEVIFVVFTVLFCTATLKDTVFLLARVTVTEAFPVFLPAVSLKVPSFFTADTFTTPVSLDVTFLT